jgi:predicted nuclease with TOPRIM domain
MKRISILLVFIMASIQAFTGNIDSLKLQREQLYAKYSQINQPGAELSKNDLEKMVEILKDLVIVDTKIINALSDYGKKAGEYETKIATLIKENADVSGKLTERTDKLIIVYFAAGAMVCMLVIALVVLIVTRTKYSRIRKNTLNCTEIMKKAENDKHIIDQLTESLHAKDKELMAKNNILSGLQNEKKTLEEKLNKLQHNVEALQKQPPPVATVLSQHNDKPEPKLAKLEKLAAMREHGIVTEEEFNTFKKKFLDEL